jgi:hypothetical protein
MYPWARGIATGLHCFGASVSWNVIRIAGRECVPHATFKFAKVIRGVVHYAEVSVIINEAAATRIEVAPDAFAWLKEDYGPNAWEWPVCSEYCAGAVSGCQYALANLPGDSSSPSVQIVIARIHARPVDTSPRDVAHAACCAVWKASNVEGGVPPDLTS